MVASHHLFVEWSDRVGACPQRFEAICGTSGDHHNKHDSATDHDHVCGTGVLHGEVRRYLVQHFQEIQLGYVATHATQRN